MNQDMQKGCCVKIIGLRYFVCAKGVVGQNRLYVIGVCYSFDLMSKRGLFSIKWVIMVGYISGSTPPWDSPMLVVSSFSKKPWKMPGILWRFLHRGFESWMKLQLTLESWDEQLWSLSKCNRRQGDMTDLHVLWPAYQLKSMQNNHVTNSSTPTLYTCIISHFFIVDRKLNLDNH